MYQEQTKTLIWKDTCTPMFIAALFLIAKTGKQPKCLSTDDWLKKIWDIHIYIYIYIYVYIYISSGILLGLRIKKKYCHLQQHGWT